MKRKLFPAFVLVCCGMGLWPVSASPADDRKLAAGNCNFAFNLLKQLSYRQSTANIFISPYSASTALQIVGTGAAGQTKSEMDQVLGTQGFSPKSLGEADKAVANSLNSNANVVLNTANAIWFRRGVVINHDFLDLNRRFFGATVESIDFADPHCVDVINAWANEKTHGRIPSIADGMINPRDTQLFLANAVYFKGKWADPFMPRNNQDRPFHLAKGGEKTVVMMTKSGEFTYQESSDFQAVRLPYAGGNLAMDVILPKTNSSLEQLLQTVTNEKWQYSIKPGFHEKEGQLMLPKFKLEYGVKLVPPLKAMGMKAAFDQAKADFSGIGPQLYISDVLQKTFVEVTEEGTEAAAVTGIGVRVNALPMRPPNRFEMIVDRPFMFLIEDSQTGTILFMGLIFEPKTG